MRKVTWLAVLLAIPVAVVGFLAYAPKVNDDLVTEEEISASNRVLAVLAHADDEVMSAGLLGHFARNGATVHLVTLTDGSANPRSNLAACREDDIRDCRARELREAARRIGVAQTSLPLLPDSRLAEHVERGAAFVLEEMRAFAPDTIVTVEPSGLNGNADHVAAHVIAMRALAQARSDGNGVSVSRAYLATLPFPIDRFLRTRVPPRAGIAPRHFLLDEDLIVLKTEVASSHASQASTLSGISLGLGPEPVFRWMRRESFYVLDGGTLERFIEASEEARRQ